MERRGMKKRKPMEPLHRMKPIRWLLVAMSMVFVGAMLPGNAMAVTVTVLGSDGNDVGGFRWLLEEDTTFHPDIVAQDPNDQNVLALNFHRSYMPAVSKGQSAGSVADIPLPDPAKHYFISVLPTTASTYTLGGALVKPGQVEVDITLNKLPIPTAQISVFVFEDKARINGVPDLPQEQGLEGFIINLEEPAGRYGANGGPVSQDAFGNPLGTSYVPEAFDAEGSPVIDVLGDGVIRTNANGVVVIKNLYPAKYGLTVSPPLNTPADTWQQTSTIEGSPVIDAWVKSNEPPYFTEFGPAGHHADFGFVRKMNDTTVLSGGVTISGRAVSAHMSRPPDYTVHPGVPWEGAWVGLNDPTGKGVYAQPCNADATFAISNVPAGNYELTIWHDNLDIVHASTLVTVNPDGSCGPIDPTTGTGTIPGCSLGDVAVYDWFGSLKGTVFYDANQNGFQDAGEVGLYGQAVNIRWRDGSVYGATSTDPAGNYGYAEVFPFFNWLVAEVDFARYKATGVTVAVDGGGPVNPLSAGFPSYGRMNPQQQDPADPANEYQDILWRTETGPVLTQAFQLFLGQTNVINWGKTNYTGTENGGISGMVFYDTTRAENDPYLNAPETWQPGIPNVTVRLWGVGADGLPNTADDVLLNETQTDSWDASIPTRCPGNPADPFTDMDGDGVNDCYDGLRNFNQVRPGVFDGGYAFTGYWNPSFGAPGAVEVEGLPAAQYVVEVVPALPYEVVRAQDKNVDFGDSYAPGTLAVPPPCVGDPYGVPEFLSLFPGEVVHAFYDPESTAFRQPYDPANPIVLNDCNKKMVDVLPTKNTAADFFLFTEVPPAGHVVGMILNDFANEFDPNNPNFGEKLAPSWVPVAFYDYTGREITRIYSDQYGTYNALVPSTYSANVPSPSGFAPNMLIACMNDPGPIPDSANPGQFVIDPMFNRQYTQFCYTFQYMPGVTTYLDTPVLPTAAFVGQNSSPLDCEFQNGTPVIFSVSAQANGIGGGPYVPATGGTLTITSMGSTPVSNPAFGATGEPKVIDRDYGFGASQGSGAVTLNGVSLTIQAWSDGVIEAVVPAGAQGGELLVTRGNGLTSVMGVTVTKGLAAGTVRSVAAGGSIQSAIDLAQAGDLILVAPGVYEELVVMYKDVQLQGWGAPSVTINAVKRPGERLQLWREKVGNVVSQRGTRYLLPGQVIGFDPANNEPGLMNNVEGPGVFVLADSLSWQAGATTPRPRIDGFTVTGSDIGGGIAVNGYAKNLDIGNNRIIGNSGNYSGGISVGDPLLLNADDLPVLGRNDNLKIHHNHITQNGCTGLGGGAGGIGLFTGTRGYEVADNYICGNFTSGIGAGIGHIGISHDSAKPNLIARNKILFNQAFNQTPAVDCAGGGIAIQGILPPVAVNGAQGMTQGTGSVTVDANLIQGNLAGAGDGGGIRLAYVNGLDVERNPDKPARWYTIEIVNNMIVNNVSGLAGGGIATQDTVRVRIVNNTIANNDSTATAGNAFLSGPLAPSTPQPAGVVGRAHSAALAALTTAGYPDQVLFNDIIWHNRSFYWDSTINPGVGGLPQGGLVETASYQDLAVLGTSAGFAPRFCILSDVTGLLRSNRSVDPMFVSEYVNRDSSLPVIPENPMPLTAAAVDEGGNFIDIHFGPLTLWNPVTGALYGDYHIQAGSPVVGGGRARPFPSLATDYDGNTRSIVLNAPVEIGADELP